VPKAGRAMGGTPRRLGSSTSMSSKALLPISLPDPETHMNNPGRLRAGASRRAFVAPGSGAFQSIVAPGALALPRQARYRAALARDLPRFRVLSTGAWNRARADVAPQDCSALAAWPGVGEQVEQRTG
jgi:hypothetical protein